MTIAQDPVRCLFHTYRLRLVSLRWLFAIVFWGAIGTQTLAQSIQQDMKRLPDSLKFDVARDSFPDPQAFSKKGWYYSQPGIAYTPTGWVATFRRADSHPAVYTDIMVAYSPDGKKWSGHHRIAHADAWNEFRVWASPQLTRLRDGRLLLICDKGQRSSGQDWPKLSDWQKSHRGMSNHLFWSEDQGKTWSEPVKIDSTGGQPSYILEMSDGQLIYTRTRSEDSDALWEPPQPWGKTYYLSESVRSLDGGEHWEDPVVVADSPFHGDCEVGLVEIAPKTLLAISRIGLGNGDYGQPSRLIYSYDAGQSWTEPVMAPIYAQRPILRKLASGKILAVYRNKMGTSGTYALLFELGETFDYEPAVFIYDEERLRVEDQTMTLRTEESLTKMAMLYFYPAQAPDSRVEIEAELMVEKADTNGCNISAGCWIRFMPDRVCLADRPEQGFDIDATQWHRYRIVRQNSRIAIFVDGELKLETGIDSLENRMVQIGNRMVKGFAFNKIGEDDEEDLHVEAVTHWRQLRVSVENREDFDIDWRWQAKDGYPDPFRRERLIALDVIAAPWGHGGYSAIDQAPDGTIIVTDYTVGGNGEKPSPMPFIRAYHLNEALFQE